jgi:hypothetical protein
MTSDLLRLFGVVLGSLLAACQTQMPAPPSPPPVAPAATTVAASSQTWPAIDWTKAPDCQAKLDLLAKTVRAGHWRSDEQAPIAVVLPETAAQLDWLAAPSVTVAADLPLEVHKRADPAVRQTDCLLLVEPARDQRVGQRLIGQETVRSLYESGVRSARNPEYDAAQVRVRQAERAAKEKTPGILRVGDPLLDMFGLLVGGAISGFSRGSQEREVEQATTALANTPRLIEQPIYRPYQYERRTILAGKQATIPVALVDRANGRLWQAAVHQREWRQFDILEGLDPRDRDYTKRSAGSISQYDFEAWQHEPPQLQLSAIVEALRDARLADGAESVTAALDRLEAAPVAPEPGMVGPIGPSPEPAFASARHRSPGRRRARPPTASPPRPATSRRGALPWTARTAFSPRSTTTAGFPPTSGPRSASPSLRPERGRRRNLAATGARRAWSASMPARARAAASTFARIWC